MEHNRIKINVEKGSEKHSPEWLQVLMASVSSMPIRQHVIGYEKYYFIKYRYRAKILRFVYQPTILIKCLLHYFINNFKKFEANCLP